MVATAADNAVGFGRSLRGAFVLGEAVQLHDGNSRQAGSRTREGVHIVMLGMSHVDGLTMNSVPTRSHDRLFLKHPNGDRPRMQVEKAVRCLQDNGQMMALANRVDATPARLSF